MGTGKTFFLENLAASLRADHVVGMVNAWQDDHANDPLVTVMAAIEDALKPFLDKEPKAKTAFRKGKQALGTVAAEAGKQVAFHALKTVAGISVDKIADRVRDATSTPPHQKLSPKTTKKTKMKASTRALKRYGTPLSRHLSVNASRSIKKPRKLFVFSRSRPL
ncbi:P-loop NTPase fold protein [Sphingomonas sp. I4]